MTAFTHLRLYWKCQLIGWSVAALYWAVVGFTGSHFSWILALVHFLADLLIYISLTHLFRNFSVHNHWHTLGVRKLVIRLIPAVMVLGLLFMFITNGKNYLIRQWFQPEFTDSFIHLLKTYWLATFATGLRLMSIWLLAYYGYHLAQREIRAEKEAARLSSIAKDAAFQNLSAQLNPHFFFNSLNSIKALVVENPQRARRAIDLLSDLLRSALNTRDSGLVTLEEEMQLVRDYLELEKIRFEDRLQVETEMDASLGHNRILPLSIQVLVENAIKHGIAPSKMGGTVAIKVWQEEAFVLISVDNPGSLSHNKQAGIGLANLKERLQLQFGQRAEFKIIQKEPATVLATIKTPLV